MLLLSFCQKKKAENTADYIQLNDGEKRHNWKRDVLQAQIKIIKIIFSRYFLYYLVASMAKVVEKLSKINYANYIRVPHPV